MVPVKKIEFDLPTLYSMIGEREAILQTVQERLNHAERYIQTLLENLNNYQRVINQQRDIIESSNHYEQALFGIEKNI